MQKHFDVLGGQVILVRGQRDASDKMQQARRQIAVLHIAFNLGPVSSRDVGLSASFWAGSDTGIRTSAAATVNENLLNCLQTHLPAYKLADTWPDPISTVFSFVSDFITGPVMVAPLLPSWYTTWPVATIWFRLAYQTTLSAWSRVPGCVSDLTTTPPVPVMTTDFLTLPPSACGAVRTADGTPFWYSLAQTFVRCP